MMQTLTVAVQNSVSRGALGVAMVVVSGVLFAALGSMREDGAMHVNVRTVQDALTDAVLDQSDPIPVRLAI